MRSSHGACVLATAIVIAAGLVIPGAGSLAGQRELSLTLRFVPQESIGAHGPSGAGVSSLKPIRLAFVDARDLADRSVVGQGQSNDDELLPVRTTSDVGEFCMSVLHQVAGEWGVAVKENADLLLEVRLVHFFSMESDKAVGSTYRSDARVEYSLKNDRGDTLYTGSAGGGTKRYGRSRNLENVNEVLSDALKEAYANMIDDSSLRAALSANAANASSRPVQAEAARVTETAGESSPDASRTSQPIAPAELLRELVELQRGSLSADFLAAYVKKKTLTAALTADDIVRWKGAAIPESVIEAATTLPLAGSR